MQMQLPSTGNHLCVRMCVFVCPLKVSGAHMGVCASPHLEHKLCSASPLLLTPPSPALPPGLASNKRKLGRSWTLVLMQT